MTLRLFLLLQLDCMTLFSIMKLVLMDTTDHSFIKIGGGVCNYNKASFISCPITFASENKLQTTLFSRKHNKIFVGVIHHPHSSVLDDTVWRYSPTSPRLQCWSNYFLGWFQSASHFLESSAWPCTFWLDPWNSKWLRLLTECEISDKMTKQLRSSVFKRLLF